ncbi:MAG: DUF2946 family protein [Zoogloeaceae bacterium]|jgi:hypothetical protein|nr:DUF2946 family protein [Zoogloeaceae bacterium]
MRSDALSVFPARPRRLALWVGLAFALGIVLQFALMTPGGARTGDAAFVEVCTAMGMQRVLFPAADDDAPPSSSSGLHCPLCVMTADGVAPPAALPAFPLPESTAARHLRLRADDTPKNPPDLRHAPPRAPPFAFA